MISLDWRSEALASNELRKKNEFSFEIDLKVDGSTHSKISHM